MAVERKRTFEEQLVDLGLEMSRMSLWRRQDDEMLIEWVSRMIDEGLIDDDDLLYAFHPYDLPLGTDLNAKLVEEERMKREEKERAAEKAAEKAAESKERERKEEEEEKKEANMNKHINTDTTGIETAQWYKTIRM